MRALVFLLVLGNLLFFAYGQGYFGVPENPDAVRWQQQVQPDKLTVASRGGPPPAGEHDGTFGALPEAAADKPAEKAVEALADKAPAKADDKAVKEAAKEAAKADKAEKVAAAKAAETCLAWHNLASSDADQLQSLLARKWVGLKVVRQQAPIGGPYWVFVPPFANKAAAERKAAELKGIGVADYFIVQEAGVNHLAISLGVFSTEQAAKDRLEVLRGQGVRSAQIGPRNPPPATVEARGNEAQVAALRKAAATLMPKNAAAACTG